MNRQFIPLILGVLILAAACSVQIYDLQPVIIGTDTPTPTVQQRATFVGVTPSPAVRSATATPPIHISPTAITAPVGVNILEIAMIDGGTGWGIGQIPNQSDKMVLRTVDGANNWKNVTPPEAIYDYAEKDYEIASCFRDGNHAWLIFYAPDGELVPSDPKIWFTEDGGLNWEGVTLPTSGYALEFFSDPQIGFIDAQTGWIFARIGRNESREFIGVYTTHDGGRTWMPKVTSDSGNLTSTGRKNGVVFRDTLEGWISSSNTAEEPDMILWHTTDGGNTWVKQQVPAPYGPNIPDGLLSDPSYSCSFSVPKFQDIQYQYAWAVLKCSGGTLSEPVSILYRTQDRLSTWKTTRLPSAEGALTFFGVQNGWYSVEAAPGADFPFEILYTEDGGDNWRAISRLAWDSKLQFITPVVGFGIVTYNGLPALVSTSDNGSTWNQIFPIVRP